MKTTNPYYLFRLLEIQVIFTDSSKKVDEKPIICQILKNELSSAERYERENLRISEVNS